MSARTEAAEARMRELLVDADLPLPDHVVHGNDQLEFHWNERPRLVVLTVELSDLDTDTASLEVGA